jgi:hypothetical protein
MANETVLLQELWRLQKTSPTVALLPTGDATTPDAVGVDFPVVLRYEGEWLLFYTAFDGQQRSIAVAASPDLQGWERRGVVLRRGEEGQFDAGGVMAAWILRHNDWDEPLPKLRRGMFWLAYSGAATPDASAAAIGLAFSPDLTRWRRFDANPILSARDGELWEKGSVGSPCLLDGKTCSGCFMSVKTMCRPSVWRFPPTSSFGRGIWKIPCSPKRVCSVAPSSFGNIGAGGCCSAMGKG